MTRVYEFGAAFIFHLCRLIIYTVIRGNSKYFSDVVRNTFTNKSHPVQLMVFSCKILNNAPCNIKTIYCSLYSSKIVMVLIVVLFKSTNVLIVLGMTTLKIRILISEIQNTT